MTGIQTSPVQSKRSQNNKNSSFFNSPISSSSHANNKSNMSFGTTESMMTGTPNQTNLNYNDFQEGAPPPLSSSQLFNDGESNWNINEVRSSLREAVQTLSNHSLKLASKWAAEQLMGLPPPPTAMKHVSTESKPTTLNRTESFEDHKESSKSPKSQNETTTSPLIQPDHDLFLYAKSLLDLGEYERAAHILSQTTHTMTNIMLTTKSNRGGTSTGITSERGPPLPYLSSTGIYFRAYAMYLAGEKRKEEEVVELRDPLERCSVTNPNLIQLSKELGKAYNQKNQNHFTKDAFCLYMYGVVLKEIQKQTSLSSTSYTSTFHQFNHRYNHPHNPIHPYQPTSQSILMQSILLYPFNWSAWLDLAEVCVENPIIIEEVETTLAPISNHWMYHFFLVHMFIEQQQHDQALTLITKLTSTLVPENEEEEDLDFYSVDPNNNHNHTMNESQSMTHETEAAEAPPPPPPPVTTTNLFSQCNFLKAMTAVAHYNMRDFDNAQQHFMQLCQRDPYRLEQMDIFSNILYVKESKAELSHLAHKAVRNDKYRPETCCIVGNYYSLKGLHEKAVHYFQRALRLDRTFLSAWTLMGHEFVEMKNTAAAIEAYRRAVDINPRDYRAWYGLGQTYEILNMLLYALFYYRKATALRPYDARMWCAMGGCYLGLDRTEDAMRSYERAVSNHDREGIATQKLATLYRDEGQDEKAANCYMRHLNLRMQQQLQVSNASLFSNPGGGSSNDKSLSDDNVINLVHVDAQEAEALLYLAFYHRDNGNYETSSKCCLRLLDYPGPEKEEAKALLREIRSRTDFEQNSDDGGGSRKRMSLHESGQFHRSDKEESFSFSP